MTPGILASKSKARVEGLLAVARILRKDVPVRVAHFIQRYPPALGGSEAYFARLSRYLVDGGDHVTVFTTNALDLEAFWRRRGRYVEPGQFTEAGVEVRRYPIWRLPL